VGLAAGVVLAARLARDRTIDVAANAYRRSEQRARDDHRPRDDHPPRIASESW
jgi:hypothetical protein